MELNESCQRAYDEGYDAYWNGMSGTRNPYPPLSDEHLSWNDGFNKAEEEDDGVLE